MADAQMPSTSKVKDELEGDSIDCNKANKSSSIVDETIRKVSEESTNTINIDSDEDMKLAIQLSLTESIVISDDEADNSLNQTGHQSFNPIIDVGSNIEVKSSSTFENQLQASVMYQSVACQTPEPSTSQQSVRRRRVANKYPKTVRKRNTFPMEDELDRESEFSTTISCLLGETDVLRSEPNIVTDWTRDPDEQQRLTSAEVSQKMQNIFKKGLEIKMNEDEAEPCRAICTKLHAHQKSGLSWMMKQENNDRGEMRGGILADEMGLGKTLTVIALTMTNHHDGRPLAKRTHGYSRPKIDFGKRSNTNKKVSYEIKTNPNVGKKCAALKKKVSTFSFFANFKSSDEEDDPEDKENRRSLSFVTGASSSGGNKNNLIKKGFTASDSESDLDEFDLMAKESSVPSSTKQILSKIRDPRDEAKDHEFDEWQKLSEDEKERKRNSLLQPDKLNNKLNLDGAYGSDDSDTDMVTNTRLKRGLTSPSSGAPTMKRGDKRRKVMETDSDSDIGFSDIDLEDIPKLTLLPSSSQTNVSTTASFTSTSSADIVGRPAGAVASTTRPKVSKTNPLFRRELPPAVRGRRPRATLIVCPTSLMSHWASEIDRHVDESVQLAVFVHHGTNKARLGADLNDYDIVITTYGTLAGEFEADAKPLLRAKWLRVILDEGHYIKNHNTKTAKAANLLKADRRWVVTGTPIQNNLIELWSLVNWLQFDLYADNLKSFKHDIEQPCKNHVPAGFDRLQTLIDTIALRRTKKDKKANGDPIVELPRKNIIIRDVELSEEEKLCYEVFRDEAGEIVKKYQRRGQLLRNYAHIFALMMRLRQLCCHRELIREINWTETLNDIENLKQNVSGLLSEEGQLGGNTVLAASVKSLAEKLSKMIRDGETEDCSICLDSLISPVITVCSHVFCRACIEKVLTKSESQCPLCRGAVNLTELQDPAIDDADDGDVQNETLEQLNDIVFTKSSSKVNAAMKEMLRIRENSPGDKIVVVSQFTSFLSMLHPLLEENDFKFARLDGTMSHTDRTDVVNLFQKHTNNSPTVLLLSLKAGGVGLTLTAANHMLLLDPAWNPAVEWQCFDRIHRIGQEKEVNIYKYITTKMVPESIEERMMVIQERKEDLINGAFHVTDDNRRRQRINDILSIFNIAPQNQQPNESTAQ